MRTRYRKRLKAGPIRINLSRSGIGTSWGVRGFRITQTSTGRRYLTLSLPGTGLSWQRPLGRSGRNIRLAQVTTTLPLAPPVQLPPPPPASPGPSGASGLPTNSVGGLPWWKQPGFRKGP